MRALRCEQSENSAQIRLVRDAPEPSPVPGEARVRTLIAGISETDLALAHGWRPSEHNAGAITMGHEFVGIVESIGSTQDKKIAERFGGKRIAGLPLVSCGKCDLCKRGLASHCREKTILGVMGRDGCLADGFTLPLRNLVALPDDLDDERATFASSLSEAIHASQQVHLEGKPYITILGEGTLALLCAQVMNKLNASVRLVSRNEFNLGLCDKWQVRHRHLDEVGRREDQDVVVDCTGSADGLATALRLVRPRGTILLKSIASFSGTPDAPFDTSAIVMKEVRIQGSRAGGISEAIEMLRREQVEVASLITRKVDLDVAEQAMRWASEADQVKVLVRAAA